MHIRKSAVHFSFDKGLIDRAKALEDCPEGLEDRAKALEASSEANFKRSDLPSSSEANFKRSELQRSDLPSSSEAISPLPRVPLLTEDVAIEGFVLGLCLERSHISSGL